VAHSSKIALYFRRHSLTAAWRYAIALAAFVISFFVRDLLDSWLTAISDRGLIVFLPAILIVTYFIGLGPATLTLTLSGLSIWYFFLPPYYSFRLDIDGVIVLSTFLVGGAIGIALVHWLRITITRAEALARQREVLIEADPNGILVVGLNGRIQLANSQLTKLFGYSQDELAGQLVEKLLPDRYQRGHVALRKRFGESPVNRPMHAGRDLYGRRKDSSEFPVEIGLASFMTESGELILANVVDITERKRAEARIAADLRDMTLLNRLSNNLVREGAQVDKNLNAILAAAIAITGADRGNVQLFNLETSALEIAAQRGFADPFLKFFAYVRDERAACSAAMRAGERVIVEDVTSSDIFAGQPAKDVLIEAGVRAVISTPLVGSTGNVLGMISTHFGEPHRPQERELRLMDLLARHAADYLERKHAEEIEDTLVREIQHRSNNLLAVIQAIANRSFSGDSSLTEAKKAFEARLQALARTYQQLTDANWAGLDLSEIVRLELQPFSERAVVEGSKVSLDPKHAQNFALALHELATNAAKYGALSNGSGKVAASWAIMSHGKNSALKFRWCESGGPPVLAPTRYGFGTALLKATFPDARVDYASEGLSCEIDVLLGHSDDPGQRQEL